MLFGKNKKQRELEQQQELEKIRLEKEAEQKRQLQKQREEAEMRAAEEARIAAKKASPYKFSVPDPMPKELISVLCSMFKKLFPEATKAYLVLTRYEDKKGYLLVVDIDAKFHKIINIYLDGETKKVRNGMPIECILYSKSGDLTDGMKPFYEKIVPEAPKPAPKLNLSSYTTDAEPIAVPDFSDMITEDSFSVKEDSADVDSAKPEAEAAADPEPAPAPEQEAVPEAEAESEAQAELETQAEPETQEESEAHAEPETQAGPETVDDTESETDFEPVAEAEQELSESDGQPQNMDAAEDPTDEEKSEPEPEKGENSSDDEALELEIKKTTVKVIPETKQQLFVLMNRAASDADSDTLAIAVDGFSEYEFYIPFVHDGQPTSDEPVRQFPEGARLFLLLNRDNGIKVITFFTDAEPAMAFAKDNGCGVACMKYKDYKAAAHEDGMVAAPAAEGIIINPDAEQILLPPDYPLL